MPGPLPISQGLMVDVHISPSSILAQSGWEGSLDLWPEDAGSNLEIFPADDPVASGQGPDLGISEGSWHSGDNNRTIFWGEGVGIVAITVVMG